MCRNVTREKEADDGDAEEAGTYEDDQASHERLKRYRRRAHDAGPAVAQEIATHDPDLAARLAKERPETGAELIRELRRLLRPLADRA